MDSLLADADFSALEPGFTEEMESILSDHTPLSGNLEILQVDFLDKFNTEYQRNNKAKGRKHLRCFPGCRKDGHVDNNYCGRPVLVAVTYRWSGDQSESPPDLVSFVEFRPNENKPAILPGMSTETLGEHWIPGIVSARSSEQNGLQRAVLAFNSEHKSWPYLWQSHRMTANTPHVLDVFIGTVADRSLFRCCGASHSPHFKLFCRKKTKSNATLRYH
jgi:hypothetical protein